VRVVGFEGAEQRRQIATKQISDVLDREIGPGVNGDIFGVERVTSLARPYGRQPVPQDPDPFHRIYNPEFVINHNIVPNRVVTLNVSRRRIVPRQPAKGSSCRYRHHIHHFQLGEWKVYVDLYALSHSAPCLCSLAVMLSDNAVRHGEAQTIAGGFCGKEGLG